MKAILKRLFIALFTEELEALTIDLHKQIERDLLNDSSFIYELSQEIIRDDDLCDEVEDRIRETIERLEGRINDLENTIEELKEMDK